MRMNRVQCSKLESDRNIPIVAKKLLIDNDNKVSRENNVFNIEQQGSVAEEMQHSSSSSFEQPLFKMLNPKTKTNHYKCTKLDNYFLANQKDMQQEQETIVDESKKKAHHVSIVEGNTVKKNELVEPNSTTILDNINCTDEESIGNMIIGYEEKQNEQGKSNNPDEIIKLDQSNGMKDCNLSIKASPIVLDLLKHIKITNIQDEGTTNNINTEIKDSNQEKTETNPNAVKTMYLSDIAKSLITDIIGNAGSDQSFSLSDFITIQKADKQSE